MNLATPGRLLTIVTGMALTACAASTPQRPAPEPVASRSAATAPAPSSSAEPSTSDALHTTYTQVCIGVPDGASAEVEPLTEAVAAAVTKGVDGAPTNVVSVRACSDEVALLAAGTTLRIDFFADLEATQVDQVTAAATSAVPGSSVLGGSVPGTGVRVLVPQRGDLDLTAQADAISAVLGAFSSAPATGATAGLDYVGPPLTAGQIDEVAGLVAAAAGVEPGTAMLFPLPARR